MSRTLQTVALTLLASGLLGCATREHELRLGDVAPLPTFEPGAVVAMDGEPSAPTLDRSAWETTYVLVPIDSVDLQVAGSFPVGESGAQRRADRLFPSPETAADIGAADGVVTANTIVEPFTAAFDLVTLPVRWIAGIPWQRDGRPLDWRERAPRAVESAP